MIGTEPAITSNIANSRSNDLSAVASVYVSHHSIDPSGVGGSMELVFKLILATKHDSEGVGRR